MSTPQRAGMTETQGAELARLLLRTFDQMVAEVMEELRRRGHPGLTAANEFALQAIHGGAATASDLGRRLGVSKQAAAKSIAALEQLTYVERQEDPEDARRKRIVVTSRGYEAQAVGAEAFDRLRVKWRERLGTHRLDELEASLRILAAGTEQQPSDSGLPPALSSSM